MERPLDQLAQRHARFYLDRASASFSQAQAKSIEGDIAGAESSAEAGKNLLTQAKGVKSLWESFASKLEQQGYVIPPLEIFLGNQVPNATIPSESSNSVSEASTPTTDPKPTTSFVLEGQAARISPTVVQQPEQERNEQPVVRVEIQDPVLQHTTQPVDLGSNEIPQSDDLSTNQKEDRQPEVLLPVASIPTDIEITPPKRVDGDLGPREEELLYARFKLNDERNDFAHEKISDVVKEVYGEQLDQITDPKQRRQKFQSRVYQAEDSMVRVQFKLRTAGLRPDKIPHYIGKFFDHIKSQPELAHLTNDQIREIIAGNLQFKDFAISSQEAPAVPLAEPNDAAPKKGFSITVIDAPASEVMARMVSNPSEVEAPSQPTNGKTRRNTTPSDTVTIDGIDAGSTTQSGESAKTKDLEPVDPKLSEVEVYALAKRLGEIDTKMLEAVGVKLTDDDMEELQLTVERLLPDDQALAESKAGDILEFRKIEAFLKNKAEIFTANLDNEDAQYVLTILAGVSDSNRLKGLLIPDVKKK